MKSVPAAHEEPVEPTKAQLEARIVELEVSLRSADMQLNIANHIIGIIRQAVGPGSR